MLVARPQLALWRSGRGWNSSSVPARILARGTHALGEYHGTIPEETVSTRIDVWLSGQLPHTSRARVQDSIRKGLALVNGKTITKPSFPVIGGDEVVCTLCGAAPLEATPERIQLDIVHEDDHVIVVNKAADMFSQVVHPAPGHYGGTLVNAILHHCGLPAVEVSLPVMMDEESDDDEGEELSENGDQDYEKDEVEVHKARGETPSRFRGPRPVIRPGIVHRLDKGTSGLIVVAKDEQSQLSLSEQFKSRKVRRTYLSLTCGTPSTTSGRIEAEILRDPRDRKRMTTSDTVPSARNARFAASRYKVLDVLANGGVALVQWKLETGRTHQIRVHARYMGFPLLGDDVYGGTVGKANSTLLSALCATKTNSRKKIHEFTSDIRRPCLHAYSLGFEHPATEKYVHFTCPPPEDFEEAWTRLRDMKPEA
ncbi:RNA pseudouridine synthase 2, chloroplastic isoform X1 [Selaginella moellendorffii]|uniref:RNA pseudouridine synthase 2, chloroplastic isoform X1 n=1 Tax=Selaginella moellendorffii TaxID=88036 RepID=UPI000D1C49C6|nr:RNA pseudouridine synthase 2, chloroplastic isoform X1 [Selaginella moellendorffii]|eukprot:XP_024538422.1 RNA pseudouridine synthase 2, chloroplastic isoform X1 [Selaginella moellendorffii]